MKLHHVTGLSEIADRYDVFLVDQFGVLHDGAKLYPDAANAIAMFAGASKAVVVMTNSGKRSEANRVRLAAMGLKLAPEQVVSSGEVAYQRIASGTLGEPFTRGRKAFVIGKRGDDYGFDGLGLEFVSKPQEADFLLILGTDVPETSIGTYGELLNAAARRKIPALCCNPDLDMLTASGVQPAPGAIAKVYETLGGMVTYIGKPHRAIYDYAVAAAGWADGARVLAVGDSVTHDVVGARDAGVAAALVLTGLSLDLGDAEIEHQCRLSNAAPDWILPSLRW